MKRRPKPEAPRERRPHPGTGVPRKTRQPLKIDRLPQDARDKILELRNQQGRSWEEIEELSEQFAGRRLPATSLQRWYDLRWEQVRKELRKESEAARAVAASFAGPGFEALPEAVRNALGDQVFLLTKSLGAGDRALFRKELAELGWLLQQYRKHDLKEQEIRLEGKKFEESKRKFERATSEAASKIGKGKSLTVDDINRLRERTFGLPPVQR